MNNANKVRAKYNLASLVVFLFTILTVQSKNKLKISEVFHNNLTAFQDTIKPGKKNVLSNKTSMIITDTIPPKNKNVRTDTTIVIEKNDTLDIKISKDSLDAVVEYSAEDSMILDVPTNKIIMYGTKTTTQYKDNNLSAPIIEFDQATGNITASIKRDSSGKVISLPTFTQADFKSQSDSIRFNMKSGKGLTKSTYTQQGEMYVYGEKIKKISNDVFFAERARITTCYLKAPHYAGESNSISLLSKKLEAT